MVGVSPTRTKVTTIKAARGEVPATLFREAVYWLHKALHVLGASEAQVSNGLPTWSLSVAYQGAFFSARSIMSFLGVGVAEIDQTSVCGDICRDMQGLRPQLLAEIGAFEEETSFHTVGSRFEHIHIWRLFQRLLRITSCDIWPAGWANYLAQVDVSEITKQRHRLHYKLTYWVTDDLHTFLYPDSFRDVTPSGEGRNLFDAVKDNFSLTLAFSVTRLALMLFSDLSRMTNRLTDERDIMDRCLSPERHPLFVDTLREHAGLPT